MRNYTFRSGKHVLVGLALLLLGFETLGETSALHLREVYLERLAMDVPTFLGEFGDANGHKILTVQPIDISSEGIPKGWELRIVEISNKRVLASRRLDVAKDSGCNLHGVPWYDPKLAVIDNGSSRDLLFHVCGVTEILSLDELTTRRTIPRIRGGHGTWAIAVDRSRLGVLVGSLRDLQTGGEACSFEVKVPNGMEAELREVLIPPDERMFGVLMHYGIRPEGKGLYVRAVGLQVHKRKNCEILSAHIFPGRVGQGPHTKARFAGTEWQWVVSGPSVKTSESPLAVWDWMNGKNVMELRYKGGTANVLDVSPDGRYVVVATGDEYSKRTVRDFVIWDLVEQRVAYESPKYSPSLKRSEYEKVVVGKSGTPAKIRTVLPYNIASFSSDGKRLLYISGHGISVYEINGQ